VTTGKEQRSAYFRRYKTPNPDSLSTFEINLYALVADHAPYYIVSSQGTFPCVNAFVFKSDLVFAGEIASAFSLACVIKADMSNMRGALTKFETKDGPYWKLEFEVGISFGTTELAANVVWTDAKVSYGYECGFRSLTYAIPSAESGASWQGYNHPQEVFLVLYQIFLVGETALSCLGTTSPRFNTGQYSTHIAAHSGSSIIAHYK
jgi:hypothetical protein